MEEEELLLYDGEEEEEGEYVDDDIGDVQMLVAGLAIGDGERQEAAAVEAAAAKGLEVGGGESVSLIARTSQKRRKKKKKKRKNKNKKFGKEERDFSVTDINRFVIDTCKHLKEKKPYLIWNAVGCLGVSVVRDLVKEVDAIQACGGQQTADGRRARFGGGILWNILKTREPKAYKEIMDKGKEFEKQFRRCKTESYKQGTRKTIPPTSMKIDNGSCEKVEQACQMNMKPESPIGYRESVLNRIRVPVAYDDLLEEGEIV